MVDFNGHLRLNFTFSHLIDSNVGYFIKFSNVFKLFFSHHDYLSIFENFINLFNQIKFLNYYIYFFSNQFLAQFFDSHILVVINFTIFMKKILDCVDNDCVILG